MDTPERRGSRLHTLLVASGVLLSTMDSSMVNVALPEIMRAFGVGMGEVKLVVLVYLMVITFSLVFWGRIGDEFGKGRVYLAGMMVFAGGAVVCSLAPVFSWLVAARAVQAVGASMMMSTGPAIVKLTSPREHLGKTLGLIGVATSCGLMSGPVVSGFMLSLFSWQGVFLVSVPPALLAASFGFFSLLPELSQGEELRRQPFDWAGGAVWVAIVVGFVVVANGTISSWYGNLLVAAMIAVLIGLFRRIEQNAEAPIMPLSLVRRRYYWTSVAAAAISFAALFIVLILLPFYLDYILEYPAGRIGLAMMAMPVSLVVVSPASGWLYDRLGSARTISTLGLLLGGGAVACLIPLNGNSDFVDVVVPLALLGAGLSIFLSPNSASVLSRVQNSNAGITSGILATARNFGMLTGTALAGTSFGLLYSSLTAGGSMRDYTAEHAPAFLEALRWSLLLALLLLLVGSAISWSRGRR